MSKMAFLPVGFLLLLLSLGPFSFLTDAAASDDDGCDKASSVVLGTAPIHVDATLCVDSTGVHAAEMRARALTPGVAYTVWFIYFDQPSQCATPGQCGAPSDFAGPNPLAVFGRLDSAVAPRNGSVNFSGQVRGLRLSSPSQVMFIMFDHGPASTTDYRFRARQLLTPQDPAAGTPHLGNVVDGLNQTLAAIAIFNIP